MSERIPFEEEAVKAYLRGVFDEFRGSAVGAAVDDPDAIAQKLADIGHPVARVLLFSAGATAFSYIYAALFGEPLLPSDSAQEGDAVQ